MVQKKPSPVLVTSADRPSLFDKKKIRWSCYVGLFLFALTARIVSNGSHFFAPVDPGYRNFEINDSSYQIRRIEMIMDDYPHVPFYDSYHYYPDSPSLPWPPGYNLFVATLAKPFDLISKSQAFRETVIGLVSCVTDAFTVTLFLFFFSRFVSFGVALTATFLLSLSSQNVGYSEIGYIDHHYFITLLIAGFSLLLYAYDRRPHLRRAVALGALLGGAVYFNVSSIQYSILGLLVLTFHQILHRRRISPWGPPMAAFGAALVTSFLSALSTPAGRQWKLQYDETSLFQFFLILCCFIGYVIVGIWTQGPATQNGSVSDLMADIRYDSRKKILLSLVLFAAFAALMAATFKNIEEGARFLLVGNILNSVQGEEASIRTYFPFWQHVFTWFALLIPFGVLALWEERHSKPFFVALVFIFFVHGILTGFAHFLYVQYLFPWFALIAALGWNWTMKKMASAWKPASLVLTIILFSQAAYSGYIEIFNVDNGENQARSAIKETIRALAWLREHTPPTSFQAKGDGLPEYSVLAHRDYGHQIIRIAHRAVIVSPFSTTAFVDHMKDYVRATFSRNEDDMVAIMEKYHARYLVLDQRDNTMVDFLLNILKGESDEQKIRQQAESLVFLFRNNLLYFDGELRWKKTPPVKHFRLIYEVKKRVDIPLKTPQGLIRYQFNGLKFFERVKGAIVEGAGFSPNERVVFRLPLKTDSDRKFDYTSFAVADERGHITTTLPYPSEVLPMSGVVPQAPAYLIERPSGKKSVLMVTEKQVANGEKISIRPF